MMNQPSQDMMAVLPDRLDHNNGRVAWNLLKDLQSISLAINESVAFFRDHGMCTHHVKAHAANGMHEGSLGCLLGRPAHLVGGQTQIAARDQGDGGSPGPPLGQEKQGYRRGL